MKTLTELIQAEANRCVRCGLCLPHCPTYLKTQHEGESPRGRIALFNGLARGKLPLTQLLQQHTDHCLGCRACEAVCPADVEYGKLLVHGRTLQRQTKRLPRLKRILNYLILHVPRFLAKPAINKNYPSLTLSPGCVHALVDRKTILDAIKLLERCHYNVQFPKKFRCCGALHAHAGQGEIADKLAETNRHQFNTLTSEKIISTATGCTPTLQQQSDKVIDINTFLNQIDWPNDITFKPLKQKALVHAPCTMLNVLKQDNEPLKLLTKIPELEVVQVKNKNCCGAAGSYFLEYPEMSNTLASDIINEINTVKPDIFVTTNIGCAIHLKRQLKKFKIKLEIIHPISLLLQQINH